MSKQSARQATKGKRPLSSDAGPGCFNEDFHAFEAAIEVDARTK